MEKRRPPQDATAEARVKTSIALPPGLWYDVRELALKDRRPASDLVVDALSAYVEQRRKGRKG